MWPSLYSPTLLLRQRQPHRARKPICQISGMRYASSVCNPTGGKVERIRCGAGGAVPADRTNSLAPASKASSFDRARSHAAQGEDEWSGVRKTAAPAAAVLGFALSLVAPLVPLLAPAPARAQAMTSTPSRPWLDPALLPAAKAEGSLIVYSSTNEQEGLPLFKLFTDATGIKVEYVRASDAVLMSRMAIEFRADQKSY